jgi:hypothetical protein
MIYEVGDIIAIRRLYLTEDNGARKVVLINLRKPREFPDSSDYYVPFQITGIGSETVFCAGGIDAFQAVQQVMPIIGAQLSLLNESCGGRLVWEGNKEGDLGFPVS